MKCKETTEKPSVGYNMLIISYLFSSNQDLQYTFVSFINEQVVSGALSKTTMRPFLGNS